MSFHIMQGSISLSMLPLPEAGYGYGKESPSELRSEYESACKR